MTRKDKTLSKYKTTHPSPNEIDRLRLQAFVTNSQDDMNAYYRAASLYFQERDVRAMNRADRIEELEAKLAKAVEERDEAFSHLDAARHTIDVLKTFIKELKGQDDE